MGHWGFVFLAYGIVWSAVSLYLVLLRSRLQRAETELSLHRGPRSGDSHEKK